jgi:Predicted ring-cleavage extradiol dioxygenase
MTRGLSLGHVHLKVSDLERSENFYRDVLGFITTMRYGDNISFLAFDAAYHHHLALNVAQTQGAAPAPPKTAGILHFAILYPTRDRLIVAARRVIANGVEIFAASDHGNSVGLYLHDPDGIEVELTWDRDPVEWPRTEDGSPIPSVTPLDLPAFLA